MTVFKDFPQLEIIQDIAKKKKISIFLVGGFLRDYLLGQTKMDFDFAVSKNALSLAQAFAKKIKGAYIVLDDERKCARVAKKQKNKIYTFDFADFRAETFKKDLAHRDFTINTLSVDIACLDDNAILKDNIKDYKSAQKDLQSKRIKMTSKKIFKEDPLRMMRAFSLRSVLGFTIEKETIDQIKKDIGLIREVSEERMREELFKVLESPRTFDNLKAMHRVGLLEVIIPQIVVMFDCKQGAYHHLHVWPHSMETVKQLELLIKELKDHDDIVSYLKEPVGSTWSRGALVKFAALLHDIGKPDTKKFEGSRYSFHGHENHGKRIVRQISKMLKLSTKQRHALEDMVQMHLRPGYLSNFKNPSEKSMYRFLRDAKEEAVSILLLSLADQRSTRGPLTTKMDQIHHEKICLRLIKKYFVKKKEKPFIRLIDGNDIKKKLKLKPSALFGKILQEVEEQQILGKIKTKTEALRLAQKVAKKYCKD